MLATRRVFLRLIRKKFRPNVRDQVEHGLARHNKEKARERQWNKQVYRETKEDETRGTVGESEKYIENASLRRSETGGSP